MIQATPAARISARLDRLPATPEMWRWVAQISFGAFFEIYEVALTALLAPALRADGIFHEDRTGLFGLPDQATFAFATFAGLFIGASAFAWTADRWGRRPVFTVTLVWYASASVIMGLQNDVTAICFWRLIGAVGLGTQVVAIDSYLAEITPKRLRGRYFAFSKFLQYCAAPIAGLLSVISVHHGFLGLAGWRWMVFAPALGAALIWVVRIGLPESPRWLAEHGREGEAEGILDRLEAKAVAKIKASLSPLELPQIAPEGESTYAELFSPQLRGRIFMLMFASATGTIGFYGFGNWLPSLLEAGGVAVTKSLLYASATALAYPLSPLIFIFIADKFERKWQVITGACLSAVFGLLFLQQSSGVGWMVTGVLISASNNLWAYAIHTYRSELFPTRVRARAIGVVYSADRLVAAFSGYIVAAILVSFGVHGVFTLIIGVVIAGAASVAIFGPRSRGLSAEETVKGAAENETLRPAVS